MPYATVPTQNPSGFTSTPYRFLKYVCKHLLEAFSYDKYGNAIIISWLVLYVLMVAPLAILISKNDLHAGHPTERPPFEVGWTSGPTTRGSFNIVWSCLSTIFTCVYVSLHLDVPVNASDIRLGRMVKCKAFLKTVGRKACWIIFNLIAPEIAVAVAFKEFQSARIGKQKIKDKRWTLTHAFFADMGGFKIKVQPSNLLQENSTHGEVKSEYVILQSGEDFYRWIDTHGKQDEIDFEQLGLEIQGMSKADWLLKTLTCMQATWLVVQTIARSFQHLPISELEVTACTYVMCTLITYVLWLRKPYQVQTHIDLRVYATCGPDWNQNKKSTPFNRDGGYGLYFILVALLLAVVVGVIYRASSFWNATFVNSNGQWLWHLCISHQLYAPIGSLLVIAITHRLPVNENTDSDDHPVFEWIKCFVSSFVPSYIGGFVLASYLYARIIMFILIGLSFGRMQAGVYKDVDWSSWFPHW